MAAAAELAVLFKADTKGLDKGIDSASGKLGKFGNVAGMAGKAALAIGGTAVIAGVAAVGKTALEVAGYIGEADQATRQLQASLGITEAEAQKFGDVGKEVFTNNWGASIGEATAAVGMFDQAMQGVAGTDELKGITESAFALRDALGVELEDTVRLVQGSFSTFGDDGSKTIDLLTAAIQRTGDPAGDLLDTFDEYSTSFQRLGFDAEQMTGVLVRGLEAGAFNADQVGDAVKEFGIRIMDGTLIADEALKVLPASIVDIQSAFNEGSITGADAMQAIAGEIMAIEDPVQRAQAGVLAFGTKWEDLGGDVVLAMATGRDAVQDFEGATERAGNAVNDNIGSAFETLKRTALTSLADLVGGVDGPFGNLKDTVIETLNRITEALPGLIENLAPIVEMIGDGLSVAIDLAVGAFETLSGVFDSSSEKVGGLQQRFQVFMDAINPIIEKAVEIGEEFRALAEEIFGDVVGGAIETLRDIWVTDFGSMEQVITELWDWLEANVVPTIEVIVDRVGEQLDRLRDWWREHGDEVVMLIQGALDIIVGIIQVAMGLISSVVGAVLALIRGDWSAFWSFMNETSDRAVKGVERIVKGLKTMFVAVFGDILKTAKDKAREIGTSIVSGIQRGIEAAWDTFIGWLMDRVGGIISAAMDRLGSASPSKEFAKIGGYIVDGLVIGIGDSMRRAEQAATDLAEGVVNSVNGALGIASPSASFMEVAKWIIDGLIAGLLEWKGSLFTEAEKITQKLLEIATNVFGIFEMIEKARDSALDLDDLAAGFQKLADAAVKFGKIGKDTLLAGDVFTLTDQERKNLGHVAGAIKDIAAALQAVFAVAAQLGTATKTTKGGDGSIVSEVLSSTLPDPGEIDDLGAIARKVAEVAQSLLNDFPNLQGEDIPGKAKAFGEAIESIVKALKAVTNIPAAEGGAASGGVRIDAFGWTQAMIEEAVFMARRLAGWLEEALTTWEGVVEPKAGDFADVVDDTVKALSSILDIPVPGGIGATGGGGAVRLDAFGWTREMVEAAVRMGKLLVGWLHEALGDWEGEVKPMVVTFADVVDDVTTVLGSLLGMPEGVTNLRRDDMFAGTSLEWTEGIVRGLVTKAKQLIRWTQEAIGSWQGEVNPKLAVFADLVSDSVKVLDALLDLPESGPSGARRGGSLFSSVNDPIGWTKSVIEAAVKEGKRIIALITGALGTWEPIEAALSDFAGAINDSVGVLAALAELSKAENVGQIGQEILDGLVDRIRQFAQALSGMSGQIDAEVAAAVASLGPAAQSMMQVNELFESVLMSPFFSASRRVGGATSSTEFRNSRSLSTFKARVKASIQDAVTTLIEAMKSVNIPTDLGDKFKPLQDAANAIKAAFESLNSITLPPRLTEIMAAASILAMATGGGGLGSGGGTGGGTSIANLTIAGDTVLVPDATIEQLGMRLEVNIGGERLAGTVSAAYQTDTAALDQLINVIDQRRRQRP